VPSYLTYIGVIFGIYTAAISNNTRIFIIAGFAALVLGWVLAEFNIWGGADSQLLIAAALFLGFSWYFVIFLYVSIVYAVIFLGVQSYKKLELNIPFVPVFLISYVIFLTKVSFL
jgi:Flp pilus assembly protein protease CpaA